MTEPRIFISYARSDGEAFATELRDELEKRFGEGTVWMDRFGLSGGEDWWRQIVDALNKVDFLVLVATPGAIASPNVEKEWRYAQHHGVCIFPVLVPGKPPEFKNMPRWMNTAHFYDYSNAAQHDKLFNDLNTRCETPRRPFMAPDLPTHFVERPAKFNELVARLLDGDRQNPVAITTALRGAGGFGKTTLAAALCHDDDVQTAFDDGVLWVTLGENPDTLGGLTKLYAALTGERPSFVDTEDAANHLSEKLAELDCLIVIDDVWNPAHLRPFLRGGERCARLITTRMMDVALGANAETTEVDEMTAEESVAMLVGNLTSSPSPTGEGSKSGNLTLVSEGLKATLRKLAERLGEWPLMLELANGALRKRMARGDTVERAVDYLNDLLTEEGAAAFDPRNPQERNQAIGASVGASLRLLETDERERLCELAIFKDDIDIPIEQIEGLWETKGREAERLCELYADLSLVKYNLEDDTVRLHDVIRDYLGRRLENASAVHARLIDSWGDPYDLIDVFAWQWFAYHLNQSGQHERLRELLLDYVWLKERLRGRSVILGKPLGKRGRILGPDINGLIADYNYASNDSDLQLVQSALMMSAHVILQDHRQLAAQLRGRLFAHKDKPEIVRFIQTITYPSGTFAALDAPLNNTHKAAGGALIRTLAGHMGRVIDALELSDGRLLSWADDKGLRLWESDGTVLSLLLGHTDRINGALEIRDGRLLSWSDDRTLRLWGNDGRALAELRGHTNRVTGALALANGRLLSWSDDGTLRLWENDGTALDELQGHTYYINGVLVLRDGRLLSWSYDGTLRLWGSDGAPLFTLQGHTNVVRGAGALADGRLLSWSSDRTLRLWGNDGTALVELRGHTDRGLGALELKDGRLLSWSHDGTLRLWGNDGTALVELRGHTRGVMGALALTDGRLLSWSNDNTLRLWGNDGTTLAELRGHTNVVTGALEMADGRLLSWSNDNTLRLWGNDGTTLAELRGHTNVVNGAAVLADGRLLSWSYDRTLRLWESDGASLTELQGHVNKVRAMVVLGERQLLSWSDDKTLRLWGNDGTALAELRGHTNVVNGAAVLADRRILSWSDDRTLRLWKSDGAALAELRGHTNVVTGAVVLGDRRLLSWSDDKTLRLWGNDGTTLAELQGHMTSITGAIALGDGRILSWANDKTLRLWGNDGTTLAELQGHTKIVRGAVTLTDGRILSWSDDRTLRLWGSDGTTLAELQDHTKVRGALGLTDGRVLSWSYNGTLRLWDDNGLVLTELQGHTHMILSVVVLEDGRLLSWARDGTLRLWENDGSALTAIQGHKDYIGGVLELADKKALSWSNDGTIKVWDLEMHKQIAVFYGDAPITCCVVLEENPLTVAAGDNAGRVMFLRLVE